MTTFKAYLNEQQVIELSNQLHERTALGYLTATKLNKVITQVENTVDVGKKIDLLTKALAFSLGVLALNLNKKKRR